MIRNTIASALLILSFCAGESAVAQGRGDRNDRGRDEQAQRGGPQDRRDNDSRWRDRRDNDGRWHDRRDHDGRWQDRRQYQGRAYNDGRWHERGAGPNHNFHRGDRLPYEYRSRHYVVGDWRSHRLSPPPHGYHWVQYGGDYILVAIATGVILHLLLNN